MKTNSLHLAGALLQVATLALLPSYADSSEAAQASAVGWLSWRGPAQTGVSIETDLPSSWTPNGESHLWAYELPGRGTPVIANGRVYVLGYAGEGPDLQEFLVCLDERTGQELWKHGFSDFLSDIIYSRYSIGSPTVDAECANIYVLTTPGVFKCLDPDGNLIWERSMMEEFGRLTFPNGRTGSPVIEGNLVIVRGITSNWGAQGPARDRFYAFDKYTGNLVWSSTPGVGPKDSSFSTPIFATINGKRVFFAGTGCGNVVCVNALSGDPLWRFQFSYGGINSSLLVHNNDKVIAIHGKENTDSTAIGRMVALRIDATARAGIPGPVVLEKTAELWRNDLGIFTSSPVLVGDRIYQTVHTGELCCVDANTGAVLWQERLGPGQLHASPLYADDKLYVPMQSGKFFIVRPSDTAPEILSEVQLEGNCLGAPSVWNGRVYVHTTKRLYCFGRPRGGATEHPASSIDKERAPQEAVRLQIVPSEVLLRPGDEAAFEAWPIDAEGRRTGKASDAVSWKKYIPATAKVKSEMDADFNDRGVLSVPRQARLSAGAFEATSGGLKGRIRGRILPNVPIEEDFESFDLQHLGPQEPAVPFAYPPLPWIGARFKWEIRKVGDSNVLAKTLANVLFQRAITFVGHPDMKDYSVEADVMTDGNRRTMSNVGLINQRYVIALIGNAQQIEISSNHSRVKYGVPFKWKPMTWYRLKTRVDVDTDGAGVIRAKAWGRQSPEPVPWTIEFRHNIAHTHGAPGIYGHSLQSRFSVYVDNYSVKAAH